MKPVFKRFRFNEKGIKSALGELEAQIMEILWRKDRASVREVYDEICDCRKIAYTTVMTVMGRLTEKNYLTKEKEGKSYIYTTAITKDEFERYLVKDIISGIDLRLEKEFISFFIGEITENDPEKLEELEMLIRERREEIGNDEEQSG